MMDVRRAAGSQPVGSSLRGGLGLGGVALLLSLVACESSSPAEPGESCGPYPAWQTSAYLLPYPVGQAYTIQQGNCSGGPTHVGRQKYAYDFGMPIGASVTAARSGLVVFSQGSFADGDREFDHWNGVVVQHDDGSTAAYVHFTQNGALVAVGERVEAQQEIGLAGASGRTAGIPHLHFMVGPCYLDDCGTLPVTFRNTVPNPGGLLQGTTYEALVGGSPVRLEGGASGTRPCPPGAHPARGLDLTRWEATGWAARAG